MTSWRETIMLVMVAGFVWYLFLTPQRGAGSIDKRAELNFRVGQQALETAGQSAKQTARNLLMP